MKPPYKLLVLTDHSNHSRENSLYGLVGALYSSPFCRSLDIGSRAYKENDLFFKGLDPKLHVKRMDAKFYHDEDRSNLTKDLYIQNVAEFDLILLRLPPPPDRDFLNCLSKWIPDRYIINRPSGLIETSSKAYLLHFRSLCPPMKICKTANEVKDFSSRFPVVLKPLNGYGGYGIIKIQNDDVWKDGKVISKKDLYKQFEGEGNVYLGMKYLRNVTLGDKRNIVVNGKLIGASLRLPEKGGWMCNVAAGGSSTTSRPDDREEYIAQELWSALKDLGIVLFGFDTLVDDSGKRVLSEINTMSVGGLIQTTNYKGKPIMDEAVDLLWDYINEVVYGNVSLHF